MGPIPRRNAITAATGFLVVIIAVGVAAGAVVLSSLSSSAVQGNPSASQSTATSIAGYLTTSVEDGSGPGTSAQNSTTPTTTTLTSSDSTTSCSTTIGKSQLLQILTLHHLQGAWSRSQRSPTGWW